jgi:hypothetical protein
MNRESRHSRKSLIGNYWSLYTKRRKVKSWNK